MFLSPGVLPTLLGPEPFEEVAHYGPVRGAEVRAALPLIQHDGGRQAEREERPHRACQALRGLPANHQRLR